MSAENSGIGKGAPHTEDQNIQGFEICTTPFGTAEGKKVFKSNVYFKDGDMFFPLLNAVIHPRDKLTIGGREVSLKQGEELWIVTLRTKEEPFCMKRHNDSPNVELSRRPAVNKETKK